eukprot:gnl/TRDRNA2_/TRDRNA2_168075_c0_seq1.p1 gnl/TRDRNA2_/TRDRNA2_168075_c0~~gnl/TRDRNA2_/TRDRNA2_168075_c0_seq1.p1  ORF type:complete len:338 (+),score=79.90 gnl/TRDRNA2_/TRDRNA2_168075_c0_seq1:634-1647(+)
MRTSDSGTHRTDKAAKVPVEVTNTGLAQKGGKQEQKDVKVADEEDDDDDGETRFAWMDSGDESGGDREDGDVPPPDANDVETLSQMLRLAESLRGKKDWTTKSLVEVCAAAARVRYYDTELFQETLGPPLLKFLDQGCAPLNTDGEVVPPGTYLTVDETLEVVNCLARLNAAGALPEVFAAAAKAVKGQGEFLSSAHRMTIKEVWAAAGRDRDVVFLTALVPVGDEASQRLKIKGSTKPGFTPEGLPMRPGQRICENYWKTGTCKNGMECRMDHPEGMTITFNSEGYPMRPWIAICSYYAKTGHCDYRKTCKWHHPEKKEKDGKAAGWMPMGSSRRP